MDLLFESEKLLLSAGDDPQFIFSNFDSVRAQSEKMVDCSVRDEKAILKIVAEAKERFEGCSNKLLIMSTAFGKWKERNQYLAQPEMVQKRCEIELLRIQIEFQKVNLASSMLRDFLGMAGAGLLDLDAEVSENKVPGIKFV